MNPMSVYWMKELLYPCRQPFHAGHLIWFPDFFILLSGMERESKLRNQQTEIINQIAASMRMEWYPQPNWPIMNSLIRNSFKSIRKSTISWIEMDWFNGIWFSDCWIIWIHGQFVGCGINLGLVVWLVVEDFWINSVLAPKRNWIQKSNKPPSQIELLLSYFRNWNQFGHLINSGSIKLQLNSFR